MANPKFKIFMTNISNYQIYERGLYTISNNFFLKYIASDLLLTNLIYFWQPITEFSLFSLRGTFLNSIFPFAGHSSQTDFEIDILLFVSLSEGILKFSIIKKNKKIT